MIAQTGLPFSGSTSLSRHASHSGAVKAAEQRPSQTARYVTWLTNRGEGTDAQAEAELRMPRYSVCSIRNSLLKRGRIEAVRVEVTNWGTRHTVWRMR